MKENYSLAKRRRGQNGFSILEMIVASAVLMVGVVSVVQLVPASLQSSVGNRMDTMATVVAQRELDQMLSQPLNVNSFQDKDGQTVNLGGAGAPGAPVVMSGQSVAIDFSGNPPNGFSLTVNPNPQDPNSSQFDLRWAVFNQTNNGVVVSRRIIVGCRRTKTLGSGQLLLPVTLDSSVQKF